MVKTMVSGDDFPLNPSNEYRSPFVHQFLAQIPPYMDLVCTSLDAAPNGDFLHSYELRRCNAMRWSQVCKFIVYLHRFFYIYIYIYCTYIYIYCTYIYILYIYIHMLHVCMFPVMHMIWYLYIYRYIYICTLIYLFITLWSVRAMPSTSTPLAFHDTNRLALQEGDLDGFQAEPWRGTLHRKQCKIPHQSGKGQGGFKFPYQSNPLVDGNGANQRFESTFMNHQSNDCP